MIFKDYYQILGVSRQASAKELQTAYYSMSKKWHPDVNCSTEATKRMQDLNEAYTLLKDPQQRKRYDVEYDRFSKQFETDQVEQVSPSSSENSSWSYDYDVQDNDLKNDVNSARTYAKNMMDEFTHSFKEASKNALISAWQNVKPTIIALACLLGIGLLIGVFIGLFDRSSFYNQTTTGTTDKIQNEEVQTSVSEVPVKQLTYYTAPHNWTSYSIGNDAFTLSIPPTMELQKEYASSTRCLSSKKYASDLNFVIFQQRGLSRKNHRALQQYCRIIIQHVIGSDGDYLKSSETAVIDQETEAEFREMIDRELVSFHLLSGPQYRWIDINGTKAIEMDYTRNGVQGHTTACKIFLLFNNNEVVKMIVSYREQEKNLWSPDLDNVIRTFRWQ